MMNYVMALLFPLPHEHPHSNFHYIRFLCHNVSSTNMLHLSSPRRTHSLYTLSRGYCLTPANQTGERSPIVASIMQTTNATFLLPQQTCKKLYFVSKDKQLWINIYMRDIKPQCLPFAPYWKSVQRLTAKQLESLVSHTLRLDSRISQHSEPTVRALPQRRSVTWLRLVQSQWLVVASSDDVTSVITLWSVTSLLSSRSSAPLAEAFLPAPAINGAIDIQGPTLLLALELRGR